jgi:hypothetical protein
MGYLVFCTFDLKNASATDYQNAYADLQRLGLKKVQASSSGGQVVIPTTSAMGELPGNDAGSVRDAISAAVQSAFAARKFKSEIFVAVGGLDWAWGARSS